MKMKPTHDDHGLESMLRRPLASPEAPARARIRVMAHLRSGSTGSYSHRSRWVWAAALVLLLAGALQFARPPEDRGTALVRAAEIPAQSTQLAFTALPRLEETARSTYEQEWQRVRGRWVEVETFVLDRFPKMALHDTP